MPLFAARLSPLAAPASENSARLLLQQAMARDPSMSFDLAEIASPAREAFERAPLSPDAVAILALTERDTEKQGRILDGASAISKRSRLLQGILLQHYAAQRDIEGILATLDRLFQVQPKMLNEAMPLLVGQLSNAASVPHFRNLLADGPSWTNAFLISAANDKGLSANLAQLRIALGRNAAIRPETDRQILAALVAAGETESAYRIYEQFGRRHSALEIDWQHEFPPFDWRLYDQRGVYARTNLAKSELTISIPAGRGGVLAERFVRRPLEALELRVVHDIKPTTQWGDVNLTLSCAGDRAVKLETALSASPMRWKIAHLPVDCLVYRLAISGRVWSNKADITGTIKSLSWLAASDDQG